MSELVEIEFVRDSEPRESTEAIRKGCRVKVSPASAERWVRRGAATVKSEESSRGDAESQGEEEPGEQPAIAPPRSPSSLLGCGPRLSRRGPESRRCASREGRPLSSTAPEEELTQRRKGAETTKATWGTAGDCSPETPFLAFVGGACGVLRVYCFTFSVSWYLRNALQKSISS